MTNKLNYGKSKSDTNWGCEHLEISYGPLVSKVKLCHVKISDIKKIAFELTENVQNTSWMMKLDKGTKRAYDRTVSDTANELIKIFKKAAGTNTIADDFGELMISIGSARALKVIFSHTLIPIAELWKPQVKQNEGFDFHTVCQNEIINFGEAKFSAKSTPHGKAIKQAYSFIDETKHYRDRVHLINLVSDQAIKNLDDEKYGVVASFSLNTIKPLTALKNALSSAQKLFTSEDIKAVYLVGVSH